MLTDKQWDQIRDSVDKVIDRQADHNAIQDVSGIAVYVVRGHDSVEILLMPTANWSLEPGEQGVAR